MTNDPRHTAAEDDLDWFYNMAESDFGLSSNYSLVLQAFVFRVSNVSAPSPDDKATDVEPARMSLRAAVARNRRIRNRLEQIPPQHRRVLEAYFEPKQFPAQYLHVWNAVARKHEPQRVDPRLQRLFPLALASLPRVPERPDPRRGIPIKLSKPRLVRAWGTDLTELEHQCLQAAWRSGAKRQRNRSAAKTLAAKIEGKRPSEKEMVLAPMNPEKLLRRLVTKSEELLTEALTAYLGTE
jgi:hypothetical protein